MGAPARRSFEAATTGRRSLVGAEEDVAVVVLDDLQNHDLQPSCENQVVSSHNLFRGLQRRDDNGRNLAELDMHYWSVLLDQLPQGSGNGAVWNK